MKCLLSALLLVPTVALADPLADHDRARQALERGEIKPLSGILRQVEADFGGELVEAELESRHGRPVYEIKLLTRDGRLLKLYYDARDGIRMDRRERP